MGLVFILLIAIGTAAAINCTTSTECPNRQYGGVCHPLCQDKKCFTVCSFTVSLNPGTSDGNTTTATASTMMMVMSVPLILILIMLVG